MPSLCREVEELPNRPNSHSSFFVTFFHSDAIFVNWSCVIHGLLDYSRSTGLCVIGHGSKRQRAIYTGLYAWGRALARSCTSDAEIKQNRRHQMPLCADTNSYLYTTVLSTRNDTFAVH